MTTDQPWRHHSLDPQEPTVKVVETFLTHCTPKEIVIKKNKHYGSVLYRFLALPLVQHSLESHRMYATSHRPGQEKKEIRNNVLMVMIFFKHKERYG
jgi:hypothetical protein